MGGERPLGRCLGKFWRVAEEEEEEEEEEEGA